VTSNYQTGVVSSLKVHPLMQMLDLGLNVTLDTDDPSISQITLSDEYRQAYSGLGMGLPAIQRCILASAQASFLPDQEREQLVFQIKNELKV
jgi:adenosine deaminase